MFIRKAIIILFILTLAAVIAFYAGKGFILERFKAYLVEKVESSTPRGITIEAISYIPLKGINLTGVTLYKDKLYKEKEFHIPNLYIKFSLIKFLIHRTVSPTVTLRNLKVRNVTLNGSFGLAAKLTKRIETAADGLESIQSIWFNNLDIKTAILNIKDINGTLYTSAGSIKTSGLRFILNGEPCTLDLEVVNPLGELTSRLKVSSPKLNLTSYMKKEGEIYKIPEVKGSFMDSPFEFIGEFENAEAPILSLYGKVDTNIEDMVRFAEGKVTSSVYFKVNLKETSSYELGIKSNADYLKIRNLKFDKFYMDARVKDGIVHVPIFSASTYNGTLISSGKFDLTDELIPYEASGRLSKIDIAALLRNTKLGKKGISGLLFSEFTIRGDAKSIDSMEGAGNIFVKEGHLGPMPLLTPLVGNLYRYFQGLFPELKKINITDGSASFAIANRRVSTDNLVLWGELASVHARGYIDFDKNLNFEAENRFLEPEKADGDDWEATLQTMISRFGKLMSKARLTGTLDKPKWKFEYLGGIENILKGKLGKVLKGIFE